MSERKHPKVIIEAGKYRAVVVGMLSDDVSTYDSEIIIEQSSTDALGVKAWHRLTTVTRRNDAEVEMLGNERDRAIFELLLAACGVRYAGRS